jgi:hypothetical protein
MGDPFPPTRGLTAATLHALLLENPFLPRDKDTYTGECKAKTIPEHMKPRLYEVYQTMGTLIHSGDLPAFVDRPAKELIFQQGEQEATDLVTSEQREESEEELEINNMEVLTNEQSEESEEEGELDDGVIIKLNDPTCSMGASSLERRQRYLRQALHSAGVNEKATVGAALAQLLPDDTLEDLLKEERARHGKVLTGPWLAQRRGQDDEWMTLPYKAAALARLQLVSVTRALSLKINQTRAPTCRRIMNVPEVLKPP